MNTLTETCRQLSEALTGDPLLLLASAVATFDPYWNSIHDEDDYDDDPLNTALRVTRGAFPRRLRGCRRPTANGRLVY